MKLRINECAMERSEQANKLYAHTEQIVEHLIKIIAMPDHTAVNHWKQEIASQIIKVNKLKGSKRFPTEKEIYKWTYEKDKDSLKDMTYISNFIKGEWRTYNYQGDFKNINKIAHNIQYVCDEYFKWLANTLSKFGIVFKPDIYEELNYLLSKIGVNEQ